MICFTSSLIRQLYYFATDFDGVLLQLVGSLNTEWAIGIWHSWLKHLNCWWKAVKIWLGIHPYLMCNCTFTWKSLNHCIWKSMPVISIKFAGYLACILRQKVWNFGSNPYYHDWNTAFFSRGLFFIGAPCRHLNKRADTDGCNDA